MASYLLLWSADKFKLLQKWGHIGRPLNRLFGGPHSSMPGFARYGVKSGDKVFLVRMVKGQLSIIGFIVVDERLSFDDFKTKYPQEIPESPKSILFSNDKWPDSHKELTYLITTCCDEAIVGQGTPFGIDHLIRSDLFHLWFLLRNVALDRST